MRFTIPSEVLELAEQIVASIPVLVLALLLFGCIIEGVGHAAFLTALQASMPELLRLHAQVQKLELQIIEIKYLRQKLRRHRGYAGSQDGAQLPCASSE
jgi:TRAP-type mannitol/chloroaromatic compound transport system permease large subunit